MPTSNRERGAAAVEFALVLPVLVLILLGIMEFGFAFFIQGSVAGAARVGVRNYAINYEKPGAEAAAAAVAINALPDPEAFVAADFPTPCTGAGAQTTFILTYRYQSLTGLLDGLLGDRITITGKGSMQCAE